MFMFAMSVSNVTNTKRPRPTYVSDAPELILLLLDAFRLLKTKPFDKLQRPVCSALDVARPVYEVTAPTTRAPYSTIVIKITEPLRL